MAPPPSNSEIASALQLLSQLLKAQGENRYKVVAYVRAARAIADHPERIHDMWVSGQPLTVIPGVGAGIAGALDEYLRTGKLAQLEALKEGVRANVLEIASHPMLDIELAKRVYKKLGIESLAELKAALEDGRIERSIGSRVAARVRKAMSEESRLLLYQAEEVVPNLVSFLKKTKDVSDVVVAGAIRRRCESVSEIELLVVTKAFKAVVRKFLSCGAITGLKSEGAKEAIFLNARGMPVRLHSATENTVGVRLIEATGSEAHLGELNRSLSKVSGTNRASERSAYEAMGLQFVEPELREGFDEIALAKRRKLPRLVTLEDLLGDLHCHTDASDGSHTIPEMVEAARALGYKYISISDHSQSLKIARGVPERELFKRIREIDALNSKLRGFRIIKSAEVDILADGRLDYSDNLLKELDIVVASIHSRFGLDRNAQTDRIIRAMENRYFGILGHATGRLILSRPPYPVDLERIFDFAKERGCFFEINSSPYRLDLSAENARIAAGMGIKIAVSTDAHSVGELNYMKFGIDQARRAGLTKAMVLNARPWKNLEKLFRNIR